MKNKSGPRAVSYVRQAAVPQQDGAATIDLQRARCHRMANKLGAEIVATYEDTGTSGRYLKRPGLTGLLERLKRHPKTDYVIRAEHSRLSRHVRDDQQLEAEINQSGATLITVQQAAPRTEAPPSDLVRVIRARMAARNAPAHAQQSLSPEIIRKLNQKLAELDRRIDRRAAEKAKARGRRKAA